MNRTFDRNEAFDSNNRINGAIFLEEADLRYAKKIKGILRSDSLRKIFKMTAVAFSLVGLVGVMGAMEAGTLGLLPGVMIGALLTGFEAIAIRY